MATRDVESAAYDPRATKKQIKPILRSMNLRRSKNGGFIAEHDMQGGQEYLPPQVHTFDKGAALLAHVAKHMGIPAAAAAEETDK